MSECTHDCSTCGKSCSERKIEKLKLYETFQFFKRFIGVETKTKNKGVSEVLAVIHNNILCFLKLQ